MIDISKIPKLVANPKAIIPSISNLIIDLSNDMREWPWRNHVVVIVGLPKAGTNWLWSMLCQVPGYNPCPGVLRPFRLTRQEQWDHDLSQKFFDTIPKDKYTVVKTHTRPTPQNIKLLKDNNASVIILVRDLRNVAVSRYFHEKLDKKSWCYKRYNSLSFEDGFEHNLKVITASYVSWIKGWFTAWDNNDFCLTRYELLPVDIRHVLSFLDINFSDKWIIEKNQKSKTSKNNLEFFLNTTLPARHRSTYSGKKRNWRDYFTDRQEWWFREKVEDAMSEYGYNW